MFKFSWLNIQIVECGLLSYVDYANQLKLKAYLEITVQVGRMDCVPALGGNSNSRNVSCSKPSLHSLKRPWKGALYKWLTRSASYAMYLALYKWTAFTFICLRMLSDWFYFETLSALVTQCNVYLKKDVITSFFGLLQRRLQRRLFLK